VADAATPVPSNALTGSAAAESLAPTDAGGHPSVDSAPGAAHCVFMPLKTSPQPSWPCFLVAISSSVTGLGAQRDAFRALHRGDLQVARAWTLKERFRAFWEYTYLGAARTFFTRWFWHAAHSRLRPVVTVAKLIQRHLPNLLTYLQHGLTNAGLEAIDAVIQWVKKTARGFGNPEHFKIAIYFHCGGVDLYPHGSR